MNFQLARDKDFLEHFDFKNAQGRPIALPAGEFKIILERGGFSRDYTVANGGLRRQMNRINWRIPAADTKDFEFSTMYYTLYLNNQEVTRGVLKIQ